MENSEHIRRHFLPPDPGSTIREQLRGTIIRCFQVFRESNIHRDKRADYLADALLAYFLIARPATHAAEAAFQPTQFVMFIRERTAQGFGPWTLLDYFDSLSAVQEEAILSHLTNGVDSYRIFPLPANAPKPIAIKDRTESADDL